MITEITEMLEKKEYKALRSTLSELQPADIAELFGELPTDDITVLFRVLPKELAAESFSFMHPDVQKSLIDEFTDRELSTILSELFVDDAVDVIEEMPANVVKRIIKNVPPEKRDQINMILRYPKNSTGTIMTTEFVELKAEMTAEDVFKNIKRSGIDKETVYTCYVTDRARHLIGVISVKDLIVRSDEGDVGEIMETDVVSVNVLADKEEAVRDMQKYGFMALPVVDAENRLVGIITADDALDVIEEENTEDIEIMAAIVPSEKTYFMTGVIETCTKRIPWLLFLMISSIFTSKILQYFEGRLTANAALIAFMPMLMGTAGNAGGQVSVTVIRSLSVGDMAISDIFRVIWKEIRVSVISGVILSVVNFGKMMLIDNVTVQVALVVSVTVLMTVIIAKLIGAVLPMVAKKIGLDPAVMASPLITTLCDAISLLLYFKVAEIILGI